MKLRIFQLSSYTDVHLHARRRSLYNLIIMDKMITIIFIMFNLRTIQIIQVDDIIKQYSHYDIIIHKTCVIYYRERLLFTPITNLGRSLKGPWHIQPSKVRSLAVLTALAAAWSDTCARA